MKKEELKKLLYFAYLWGRDNGEGRSEKNFNDFLQTSAISKELDKGEPEYRNVETEKPGVKRGRTC